MASGDVGDVDEANLIEALRELFEQVSEAALFMVDVVKDFDRGHGDGAGELEGIRNRGEIDGGIFAEVDGLDDDFDPGVGGHFAGAFKVLDGGGPLNGWVEGWEAFAGEQDDLRTGELLGEAKMLRKLLQEEVCFIREGEACTDSAHGIHHEPEGVQAGQDTGTSPLQTSFGTGQ